MGKEPPPIIDADFEVVTPPTVQWMPAPKPRLAWYNYVARAFCVLILVFAAWDILSDGVPTRSGRTWLEAKDTTWLDNVGYIFNFARNGELPPASATEPSQ